MREQEVGEGGCHCRRQPAHLAAIDQSSPQPGSPSGLFCQMQSEQSPTRPGRASLCQLALLAVPRPPRRWVRSSRAADSGILPAIGRSPMQGDGVVAGPLSTSIPRDPSWVHTAVLHNLELAQVEKKRKKQKLDKAVFRGRTQGIEASKRHSDSPGVRLDCRKRVQQTHAMAFPDTRRTDLFLASRVCF